MITELSLPESILDITQTHVIHKRENGEKVFEIDLESIDSIYVNQRVNPIAPASLGSACACIYIAYWVSESTMVTILFTIIACVLLLAVFGIMETRLHFLVGDETYKVSISDSEEEFGEFVSELRRRIYGTEN